MKMLVVVDFQHDFIDGMLGFEGAENLDAGIAAKIREYDEKGDFIIETKDTHTEEYLRTREGEHLPVEHCLYGTKGWETYGETGKLLRELEEMQSTRYRQIRKATFPVHPYDMVDMMDWIRMNEIRFEEIEEIEFVGLVSNICVISNICVFQGAFPNAQVVVDPNLIASFNTKAHEAVLEVMLGLQVVFIGEEK
jgi:nicotinamidase-related amidase